ncbi:hypothetical protein ACS0TY_033701 [Phlomoides rotata]
MGAHADVEKMPLGFCFDNFEISPIHVWITLKFLPMCCWNNTALSHICSQIGRPIQTDRMTLIQDRVSYIRVLVEVDAAKPLVRAVAIKVGKVEWLPPVDYEFEPQYCMNCGKFGHGCTNLPTFESPLGNEEERMRSKGRRLYEKKDGEGEGGGG